MPFDTKPEPRIRLYSRELVYTQESDTWDGSGMDQELRITTLDGGGGSYVMFSTQRWAIDRDEIPQLVKMLTDALEGLE